MYFDKLDICEAYYLYFTEYHTGQFSREYSRLSKLLTYFTPRDSLREERDLTDNGNAIYIAIVEREQS